MPSPLNRRDAGRKPCSVCGTGQIVAVVAVTLTVPVRFQRRLTKRVLRDADVRLCSAAWDRASFCCSTPGCHGPAWLRRRNGWG